MLTRFATWMNEVNTTSFRIVMSVVTTCLSILLVLVAIVFFDWQPKPVQITVLTGIAGVVLTMMGFDVIQYIGKRFSDRDLAAARQAPSPVQVDQASLVTAGGDGPTTIGSPVSASSAVVEPPTVRPAMLPGSEITDAIPPVKDD